MSRPQGTLNASGMKGQVKTTIKQKLVDVLESTDILDDEDLKNILISLTTNGWKQENGTWRKL